MSNRIVIPEGNPYSSVETPSAARLGAAPHSQLERPGLSSRALRDAHRTYQHGPEGRVSFRAWLKGAR